MDLGLLDDPPPNIPIMCFLPPLLYSLHLFKVLSSHLNLGLLLFQELSGWEKTVLFAR
jgi:hypothetical protein